MDRLTISGDVPSCGRDVGTFPPDDRLVDRIASNLQVQGQFVVHIAGDDVDEIARIRSLGVAICASGEICRTPGLMGTQCAAAGQGGFLPAAGGAGVTRR